MNLFHKIAAAAFLMLSSTVAHAQAIEEVGPWGIYKNQGHCRALALFNNSALSIAHYKADNRTTIMILDKEIFAAAGSGTKFDAQLVFVRNDDLDTTYASLPLTGVQLDNGMKGVFIQSPGDNLVTTFGQSSIVGLLKGSDVVISIKIEVPGTMIAALRKCSATT